MEPMKKNTARKSFPNNHCSVHIEKLRLNATLHDTNLERQNRKSTNEHSAVENALKLNPNVIDRLKKIKVVSFATNKGLDSDSKTSYKVKDQTYVKPSSSSNHKYDGGVIDKHSTSHSSKNTDVDSRVSSAHKSKSHSSSKHKKRHSSGDKKDRSEKHQNNKPSHKVIKSDYDSKCGYTIKVKESKTILKSDIYSKYTKPSDASSSVIESFHKEQQVKSISKENIKQSRIHHQQSASDASPSCTREKKEDKNKKSSLIESTKDRKCLKEANSCLEKTSSMKRKHDSLLEKGSGNTCRSHEEKSSHKKHRKLDLTSVKSSSGDLTYSNKSTIHNHTTDSNAVAFTESQVESKTVDETEELARCENSQQRSIDTIGAISRIKQRFIGEMEPRSVLKSSMKRQSKGLTSHVTLSSSPCRSGTEHSMDILEMEENQITDANNDHSDSENTVSYSDKDLDDSDLPSVSMLLSSPPKSNVQNKTTAETERDDECRDILNNELSHVLIVDPDPVANCSDQAINNHEGSFLSVSPPVSKQDVLDANVTDHVVEVEVDVADPSELLLEKTVPISDEQKQDISFISESCTVTAKPSTVENSPAQLQQQDSDEMTSKHLDHQSMIINSEGNDTGLVITSVTSQYRSVSESSNLALDKDRNTPFNDSAVEHKKCQNIFNVNPQNSVTCIPESVAQEQQPQTKLNAFSQFLTSTVTDNGRGSISSSVISDNHENVCDKRNKQSSAVDTRVQSEVASPLDTEKTAPQYNSYTSRAVVTSSKDSRIPAWVTVHETFMPVQKDPLVSSNEASTVVTSPKRGNTDNNEAHSDSTAEKAISDKNLASVATNPQEQTPPQTSMSKDVQIPLPLVAEATGLNTVFGIQLPDLRSSSTESATSNDAQCSFVLPHKDVIQDRVEPVKSVPSIHKATRKKKKVPTATLR